MGKLAPEDDNAQARQEQRLFPSFNYYLDESGPDIVTLRRQDGSFVAAFSAGGATNEGIIEAAKEDYRELLRVHWVRRRTHAHSP
jgi:hypothetical protein